jgi:hypothetical protein
LRIFCHLPDITSRYQFVPGQEVYHLVLPKWGPFEYTDSKVFGVDATEKIGQPKRLEQ